MSRLTVTSYYTRKTVKIVTMALILFITLKTSISLFRAYWRKLHPLPPPPPDTLFGKLPKIKFPENNPLRPKTFQLETAEGSLPTDIPTSEKIYFIPSLGGKFLTLDKATNLARALEFKDQPQKISEDTFYFENPMKKTSMTINVLTGSFQYSYAYLTDQTLINPPSLPEESDAIMIARTFLERISKLTEELKEGEYKTNYWKISGDNLVSANAASEADFVRIDIFRKKLADKYPVLPANPNQSLVSILICGIKIQGEQVVEVKYTHFKSDREKFSTYPIKTAQQAWDELNSGDYHLASSKPNVAPETIKIRKVYLAYFDPDYAAKFLQPIFVFQGDNQFYGYVTAIPSEWSD